MTPLEAKAMGATHYNENRNSSINLYYRQVDVNINDGSRVKVWEYISSFNIWQPSATYNSEGRSTENLHSIDELILRERAAKALQGAIVTRGKRKGMLLAKCPPVGTDAAAAWQAVMKFANPFKCGFGHLLFMPEEQRHIRDYIVNDIKSNGRDVRGLDRDRKALEALGVW